MMNSEILNVFDEKREEFKPYGITCEVWTPSLMRRPDRHNEIELNYFGEGAITYLFHDKKITIPSKKLALFWGLIPHQIIDFENITSYFVCTIPFSQFLEWKLPTSFVDGVLRGEVLLDGSEAFSPYDEFLLNNWISEFGKNEGLEVTLLEMRARLLRMAHNSVARKENNHSSIHSTEISQVERIAIYIAQNYAQPIKAAEIGEAVGLHPDYANTIFRKAFGSTLSEHIMKERISHAQRQLAATDTSITEIAFQCGFNSISRFNACFMKMNGCTPREFRRRYL
ncbi:MAG: helix-turn-helix domain-containing protein [Imperialibacter sp.]|uniref:helix-turn-helix domain-containing protein n=1 Tax=Imperialibacter sp. TaxID=2038411 RepID=UPI003A873832